MENDEIDELKSRNNYLALFVQKQEKMLLDYLRQTIDGEIKLISLNSQINDLSKKYEESQKQVELQNDMMNQAAKGLEITEKEKQHLQQKEEELLQRIKNMEEDFNRRITSLDEEKNRYYNELTQRKQDISSVEKQKEEFNIELKRQNEELSALYKETQELKKRLEKYEPPEKNINKKTKATLPPDEF